MQQRRVRGHCTDSGLCTFSTDYLVICGRASARSMGAACATLESPLDSSKHIIAQVLRPTQRFLIQGFQLSASFVHQSGSLSANVLTTLGVKQVLLLQSNPRPRSMPVLLARHTPRRTKRRRECKQTGQISSTPLPDVLLGAQSFIRIYRCRPTCWYDHRQCSSQNQCADGDPQR
jgi:hypothetical protein